MGTKTSSTASINIPIYAAWKCSECGEKNFSEGILSFSSSSSTRSFPTKRELERIERESENQVNELLRKKALAVISDPIENYSRFRECVHIYHCNCHKCGNKEKWNKGMGYMVVFAFDFIPTIISLLCVIFNPLSFWAWLFFSIFLIIMGCCIYSEYHFKTILKKIPKNSMPVIGSLYPKLVKLANEKKFKLLSPEEVLEKFSLEEEVTHKDDSCDENKETVQIITDSTKEAIIEDALYCRKCGTKLLSDSAFCHKCGCEVIH